MGDETLINGIYSIYKIRDKCTNEVHEREFRRQGHKLKIMRLEVGQPMVFEYVEGGYLTTSLIESFRFNWDDSITITTMNSIYRFELDG